MILLVLSHAEKILLATIEKARADLLFSDEVHGRKVLLALEKHLPADVRLGECLSTIKKHSWDPIWVDRSLAELHKNITNPQSKEQAEPLQKSFPSSVEKEQKVPVDNLDFESSLKMLPAEKKHAASLLGVSPSTISSWEKGKKPSSHNKKKVILLADILQRYGEEWSGEKADAFAAWKKGPLPEGLNLS